MKNYSLEKNSTLKEDEFKNEISVINNSAVKMVKKIEEELEKRILYEKEIMQKNRLASMGEMIDNIAHQWRQPLMKINAIVLNTDRSIELKKYDEKYLQNRLDDISQAVYHMSNTIDTFREFLNPHKAKESFEISNSIKKSLKVLNTLLVDIEVNINQKEIYINAYESEFMQVIISILSNSIDIFKARDIEKKYINIDIYEDDIHYFISIKDSAGGIKEDIIDKIFEPYFTTKHKSGGTGMGLYISKLIIQSSFKGDIKVKAENPTLLSSDDIENISKELQKDVADLKNDLESIEKEFTNKELQVEDQNKYIADMYPIIGASIISETLAHEIIRLSNNIKSYTTSIRGALGRSDKDGVNLNIKLIESDIKFLARYASLLDVNSYSKRRRFDKLWVAKSIDEIVKDSPLLEYKETKINYILSGSDFESTLVKDSFKIIIENFLINSAYWLERYSIRRPSIHFDFNGRKKQLIIYDNGIGISKDIAKRIFEPFVTNKPSGDGRGMGLYIVNNLLNEIGATIDLSEKQNENGNLYQFIITFPEDE